MSSFFFAFLTFTQVYAENETQGKVQFGLVHDSNIISSPTNDTSAGIPLDDGGLRAQIQAEVSHLYWQREDKSLHGNAKTIYLWSFDDDFAQADPWLINLNLPYLLKNRIFSRENSLTFTPAYESIYMDYDSTGNRMLVLNAFLIEIDLQLKMSAQWQSGYTMNLRYDDSQLVDAADNNADAAKITLKKSESFWIDGNKNHNLLATLAYVKNDAEGRNKIFNRIDASCFFKAPLNFFENSTWHAGLNAYWMDFPDQVVKRSDTNLTFSAGIQKKVNDQWDWEVTTSISSNSSDQDVFTYDRFAVLGLMGYSWGM